MNMCESCPECPCNNSSWPALDDLDSLLDTPQMREDPDMADLAEEATAAEAAAADDALWAIPDMRDDLRRADEAAGVALSVGGQSDDNDIDIGATFYYDEFSYSITECGNDVQ